ncbi:MAG TPA: hypothetical protein VIH99_09505 [Bdellovibrionota bacterium]|jgi:hypothetical protein
MQLDAQGHQYRLDRSLTVRGPDGREKEFSFDANLKLKVSPWTGELRIKRGRISASLSPLSAGQLKEFLPEFFRHWNQAAPESAQKAAFDYVDAQRGFVPLAFAVCLLFTLPVSVALLADSHQQFSCTRLLRESSVPGAIDVKKATKKDSRTYKVKLEFTAPNGQLIRAEDLVTTKDEKDIPKSFPILYSPEHPECWSLTKDLDSHEINWAKRRYFATFAFLFGMFFLGLTLLGLAWATIKRLKPRPFASEIQEQFGLQL